jgi:hypothetical protein
MLPRISHIESRVDSLTGFIRNIHQRFWTQAIPTLVVKNVFVKKASPVPTLKDHSCWVCPGTMLPFKEK